MSPYQLVRGMRARHGQPLLALQALMDTFRAQAYAAGYQPVTEFLARLQMQFRSTRDRDRWLNPYPRD